MSNKKSGNQFETDENWLPVRGFEEAYLVSNLGNIWSLRRNKLLRVRKSTRGYGQVNLSLRGVMTTHRVHRLVATHFLPNPLNLTEVNHLNENKLDNRVENLEWCTRSHNVNYGNRTEKQKAKVSIPVVQFSLNGTQIAVYPSVIQAARELKLSHSSISECCRGKRKTLGGYKWKYAQEVKQ